jgi:hypothetical protein
MSYETRDPPETKDTSSREAGEQRSLSPAGQRAMQGVSESQAAPVNEAKEVNDIRDVPLSQIKDPGISGPEDFRSDSYEGMNQELDRLQQLRSYVETGQAEQVADDWDRQAKLGHYSETGYTRGYTDAYKSYYQTDPVALSPTEDGQYDILNGRHRVYLAQSKGMETIPARVIENKKEQDAA